MFRGPDHIAMRIGLSGLCAMASQRTTSAMTLALLALLLSLVPFAATAQTEEGQPKEVRVIQRRVEVGGVTYAWSVLIPDSAIEGGPAILFLHGAGECGTDGEKNLAVGLPRHVREHPEHWPFVVIVPQKPTRESEWEDHERAVLSMLDEASAEGLYDPGRLAITGLSQGGHGTIVLASMHPDRFRCAAPVCGYVDRRFSEEGSRQAEVPATQEDESVKATAKKLSAMPVWLFHGSRDDVVPPEESRSLHAAIVAIGGQVDYTEFPEANHNAWDPAYSDAELAQWFTKHTQK